MMLGEDLVAALYPASCRSSLRAPMEFAKSGPRLFSVLEALVTDQGLVLAVQPVLPSLHVYPRNLLVEFN